jgi:4-hydroxy-2-oxoheptanedioate aldolase
MRPSRILAKLRQGEPALVTCLHSTDAQFHEMTSLLGFDGIWLDLEHHATGEAKANELMRAARVGVSDIVARPGKGEFMRMGRLLEAGATGIMYPRCSDPAEAAEVVRWAKFAPLGQRGFDGGNPDNPYCSMPMAEYVPRANEETFVIVQLEEPSAVARAEEIARVPGVDMLMFGPGDFTVLSGIPGQFEHPQVNEAIRTIAAAAKAAGKHWGMPAFSTEHARQLLELGARILFRGSDITLLRNAQIELQQQLAPLGFQFAVNTRSEHDTP